MNVLSLFDGMSCAQIALDRLGVKVNNYFASELDKWAITVTQNNYPNTRQLGDVTSLKASDLPRIDLLIGGSPCQGFSFAGKQLNFKDPRSKLFFEFVRLKKQCNPRLFLLENVKMKKEYQDVITNLLGVEPIEINSSLVSAQNRKRLYWTNIKGIQQPKDKGVLLKDVLQGAYKMARLTGRYLVDGKRADSKVDSMKGLTTQRLEVRKDHKSGCLTTVQKDNVVIYQKPRGKNKGGIKALDGKTPTLTSNSWQENNLVLQLNPSIESGGKQPYQQNRIYSIDGKSAALTSSKAHTTKVGKKIINVNPSGKGMNGWVYDIDGKSPTLTTNKGEGIKIRDKSKTVRASGRGSYDRHEWDSIDDLHYRKLTPLECERLQTVPDNYTAFVSNTQRYKMLGNGFTVDVIAHILSYMKVQKWGYVQTELF